MSCCVRLPLACDRKVVLSEALSVSAQTRAIGNAFGTNAFAGNSGSDGWIFMRVRGYYGNGALWVLKRRRC